MTGKLREIKRERSNNGPQYHISETFLRVTIYKSKLYFILTIKHGHRLDRFRVGS